MMPESSDGKIAARLAFPRDEGAPAVFANHMTVQFMGDVYIVTFYAAFPPLVTSEEALADGVELPAHAVARLAIPAEQMSDIVKALNVNLDRTKALSARKAGDSE